MLTRFTKKTVDREWLNTNFPCMMACPAHTNAGRYVSLIAEGRFRRRVPLCARDPNPMASICGRVCAHPCETACRRGQIDRPISIRALKRFLTERHGPESHRTVSPTTKPVQKLPYKEPAIRWGAVPSDCRQRGTRSRLDGLFGHDLRGLSGWRAEMLYLGIPEYRLPRNVVEAQVREILETGDITLRLNSAAGQRLHSQRPSPSGFRRRI